CTEPITLDFLARLVRGRLPRAAAAASCRPKRQTNSPWSRSKRSVGAMCGQKVLPACKRILPSCLKLEHSPNSSASDRKFRLRNAENRADRLVYAAVYTARRLGRALAIRGVQPAPAPRGP